LNPSAYKHEHGILKKPRPMKDPYNWNTTTVHKILDAPEYLGITINFKTYSKSYKDKRSRMNPEENRLVFEGTHPAIIQSETWEIVRRMREHKRRAPRYGNPGLFSGAAYCSDCGGKLYYHTREIWNKARTQVRYEGSYSCAAYRKDVQYQTERLCTCHYIREIQLEQLVLDELRELLSYAARDEKEFTRRVMEQSRTEQADGAAAKLKAAKEQRRRVNELDTLFERLYEDRAAGKITEERFEKLSAKYEDEQAALKERLTAAEREIADAERRTANTDRFLELVRRYTAGIEKLTPAIVHEFIDKVIVHEPESKRKNREQKIEVIYNNIGALCLSDTVENAETLDTAPPTAMNLVASF
ncbi:MAG: DUF4368 domain-containing protein, partial [Oscillospiraceae bacterium]|nr:DUF4368 domain-containing protein [Oscillospiraceae bacterium]